MKAVDLDVGGESVEAANEELIPFHVILGQRKAAASNAIWLAALLGFILGSGLTIALAAVVLYH